MPLDIMKMLPTLMELGMRKQQMEEESAYRALQIKLKEADDLRAAEQLAIDKEKYSLEKNKFRISNERDIEQAGIAAAEEARKAQSATQEEAAGKAFEEFQTPSPSPIPEMEQGTDGIVPMTQDPVRRAVESKSRAQEMQELMDAHDAARKRKAELGRQLGGRYGLQMKERFGQTAMSKFADFGDESSKTLEEKISSAYETKVGNSGEIIHVSKVPGGAYGLPEVISGTTMDALRKDSEAAATRQNLKTVSDQFSTALKEKQDIPEDQYIAYADAAPAQDRGRIREEFLRNQNENGYATPAQKEEWKYITDKKALELGDLDKDTITNADGTTSTAIYKKADRIRLGAAAKPIAVVRGSPKNLEDSVKGEVQKKYLASNQLVGSLKEIDKYVKPEYLQYANRAKEEVYNILIKAGWKDEDAKKYVYNFELFKKSTMRAFNAYRIIVTGAQASEQELQRIEKSFLGGSMSYPEFQAAMDSLLSDAEIHQGIYHDAIGTGLPSPVKIDRSKSPFADKVRGKFGD